MIDSATFQGSVPLVVASHPQHFIERNKAMLFDDDKIFCQHVCIEEASRFIPVLETKSFVGSTGRHTHTFLFW